MNEAAEGVAIGIIGGADGPTTIYVAEGSFWFLVVMLALYVLLFLFVMIRFIKNLKSKNKVRSIIYGSVVFLFLLLGIGIPLFRIGQIKQQMTEELESFYTQSSK